MAKIESEILVGKTLEWKGEFDLKNKFIPEIICTDRKNEFSIVRDGITINVLLIAKANIKEILLTASENTEYENLSNVLFELLKYENLFDGRFYETIILQLDGMDIAAIISQRWLPYFGSKKSYTYICLKYDDDTEYKSLFQQWNEMCDNLGIIHQMYLYSCYSSDITPDVKLALLLQTFEPISDILNDKGKIVLTKTPYITKSAPCNHCGEMVSATIKNKELLFSDRIRAVINKYGVGIFDNDNKEVLIEKSVNLRNKVVHLDCGQTDVLTGKESGVYLYKFSLLYRNIVLNELGLESSGYNVIIENWIRNFDREFNHCMIQ